MQDGRLIRRGLFYRSCGLYMFDPQELEYLSSLNIRNIIDLRTERECIRRPDAVPSGSVYHNAICMCGREGDDIDFSPAGMKQAGEKGQRQLEQLRSYYLNMPFDNEAFRLIVRMLRERDFPLLFHCATGKDRTGVISALIMLLLGADDWQVTIDYLTSNDSYMDLIEETIESEGKLAETDAVYLSLLLMMKGVDPKIMRLLLEKLHSDYPDIRDFFAEQYGLSRQEIEEIRDFCLEEDNDQLK